MSVDTPDVKNDVDLERPDAQESWSDFDAAVRRWQGSRESDFAWHLVTSAYERLRLSLEDDDARGLWRASKTDPRLEALQVYGRRKNWIRQQHPGYKKDKAAYDEANNKRPKRKRQLKAAKRRYRAKRRTIKSGGAS